MFFDAAKLFCTITIIQVKPTTYRCNFATFRCFLTTVGSFTLPPVL